MNTFHIFVRYSLVGVLLLGLYLLWDENQSLKSTLTQVTNQLNITEDKNQKLQQILIEKEQKLKIINAKIKNNNSTKVNQSSVTVPPIIKQKSTKEIVIVLPEKETNYSKIIPKIDYKNIPLDKEQTNKTKDEIKINPEVFIDKDEKKINGGKIQIETKF